MSWTRLRFGLALALFVAWTGWLVYQAATSADTIVVSRPQVFFTPIVVDATVPDGGARREATVTHVYRGEQFLGLNPQDKTPADLKLTITNFDVARGWQGPSDYLLCLHQEKEGGVVTYEIAGIPNSPGFPPNPDRQKPIIYPSTPSTRGQLREALLLSDTPVP